MAYFRAGKALAPESQTASEIKGRPTNVGFSSPPKLTLFPPGCHVSGLRCDGVLRDIEAMPFWCCAQLDRRHERMALHCLRVVSGLTVYQPRIKSRRRESEPLFCNYVFVAVELQWHLIRWSPGVVGLLMSRDGPARVPDRIVEELRSREVNGLVRLPPPPRPRIGAPFQQGDKVRVASGPMSGLCGLVSTMKPRERVEVLLEMLGSLQRVELAASAVRMA